MLSSGEGDAKEASEACRLEGNGDWRVHSTGGDIHCASTQAAARTLSRALSLARARGLPCVWAGA
eukprot:3394348-Pleurochrysis_carterae.AAC.1